MRCIVMAIKASFKLGLQSCAIHHGVWSMQNSQLQNKVNSIEVLILDYVPIRVWYRSRVRYFLNLVGTLERSTAYARTARPGL